MDYESKYKEALEWARGIYPNAAGADKEDLEHYFPELKESEGEDERIRNDLKRAISVALDYSYLDKECANNCLAWLEKQGEQKPSDNSIDAFIDKACEYISCHQCEYIDFDDFRKAMKGE